jgi:hypothetical protein
MQSFVMEPVGLVSVVLEARGELHGRLDQAVSTSRRISLGEPRARRLNPEELTDTDTANFLKDEALSADFWLISLTVNFYPEPDEPIDSAAIGLRLSHNGPADAKPAIAWSVWPAKLSAPMSTTSTVAVTAKLGLIEPNASRTTTQDRDKPYLLGLGEGQSDPEWRFRRSSGHEIEGIQHLATIIRAPRGAQVTGEITIAASILRRVAGLVRYRALLPPGLATVSLPAHR